MRANNYFTTYQLKQNNTILNTTPRDFMVDILILQYCTIHMNVPLVEFLLESTSKLLRYIS